MELLDLVDRDDNVIGTSDRDKAHKLGLLHRVVLAYVFNQKGELYVQVHKKSGGLFDHSVGGHVDQGENYEQAVKREAEEELSITQPLHHVATFYSDEGIRQHMFSLYECVAEDSWQFQPNDEVEEIFPMKVDDICQMMKMSPEKFTKGFINSMAKYLEIKA